MYKLKVIFWLIFVAIFMLAVCPGAFAIYIEKKDIDNTKDSSVIRDINPFYSRSALPTKRHSQYKEGEVLVKFKEGANPQEVIDNTPLKEAGIERIHSIKQAAKKYLKDCKLEKDSGGWYWFLGKSYKEITDVEDEKLFQQAYQDMNPQEKALYRTHKITLPKEISVEEAVSILKQNPNIEYAEPNYKMELCRGPNDPFYQDVYPGNPVDRRNWGWDPPHDYLYGLKQDKLNCEPAWDLSQGKDIVVAVIDTGVDYNHEDLAENIWINSGEDLNHNGIVDSSDFNGIDNDNNGYVDDIRGYDFSDNDSDPLDYFGHGTHCAGTIAAVGNNSIGVIGVAPKAKVMPVKIFPNAYEDVCVQAIKYAADNGADVLSNSWGPGIRYPSSPVLEDAIDYAYNKGCVVVFAAGNNNDNVSYYSPANYPKTIAVAATDHNDQKAVFSNYGNLIDVSAPGVDILSLRAKDTDMYEDGTHSVGDNYYRASGTSMACPHVAGEIALLLSVHPEYNFDQIKSIIKVSATDDVSSNEYIGVGRIDPSNALNIETPPDGVAKIANPPYGPIIGNEIISIIGSAIGDSYRVLYSNSENPYSGNWTPIETEGPEGNGEPVMLRELARLDTAVLETGYYYIKLSVEIPNGYEMTDVTRVYIDRELMVGWPQQIVDGGEIVSSPKCADLDMDGHKELFCVSVNSMGKACLIPKAYLWNADGSLVSGWPKAFDGVHYFYSYFYSSAAFADLDGDGDLEIVLSSTQGVYIWHHDGTELLGWPKFFTEPYTIIPSSPSIGDINGDGKLEIVISMYTHGQNKAEIFAWDAEGNLLDGWPFEIYGTKMVLYDSTVALADLDNDGSDEIIMVSCDRIDPMPGVHQRNTYIHVLDGKGNLLPGWPQVRNGDGPIRPSVGDVNNDGELEIFFSCTFPAAVYGLDRHGNNLPGWPVNLDTSVDSGLTLADLDYDGDLEIAFQDIISRVHVYHHDGSGMIGWPKSTGERYVGGPFFTSSVVVGDIDGDDSNDIIVGAKNSSKLYAFSKTGTILPGFPKLVGNDGYTQISSTPIITDFNNDGNVDIIVGGRDGRVYVWDLPAPLNYHRIPWPMFQHDLQNTGCYGRQLEPTNFRFRYIMSYNIDIGIHKDAQRMEITDILRDESNCIKDFTVQEYNSSGELIVTIITTDIIYNEAGEVISYCQMIPIPRDGEDPTSHLVYVKGLPLAMYLDAERVEITAMARDANNRIAAFTQRPYNGLNNLIATMITADISYNDAGQIISYCQRIEQPQTSVHR